MEERKDKAHTSPSKIRGKKRQTFEAGFLDPALEAGLTEGALEAAFALEPGLDAGLAAVSGTGSVVVVVVAAGAACDVGLEAGALAFDAGLAYEIKHQMSQKC